MTRKVMGEFVQKMVCSYRDLAQGQSGLSISVPHTSGGSSFVGSDTLLTALRRRHASNYDMLHAMQALVFWWELQT